MKVCILVIKINCVNVHSNQVTLVWNQIFYATIFWIFYPCLFHLIKNNNLTRKFKLFSFKLHQEKIAVQESSWKHKN